MKIRMTEKAARPNEHDRALQPGTVGAELQCVEDPLPLGVGHSPDRIVDEDDDQIDALLLDMGDLERLQC